VASEAQFPALQMYGGSTGSDQEPAYSSGYLSKQQAARYAGGGYYRD